MASIADIVTGYQAARKAYENALSRVAEYEDVASLGQSLGIAGQAVAAAANAIQTARLIAEAREKLGPDLTEDLLGTACNAAAFATDAADRACALMLDLTGGETSTRSRIA
jgi:hypothetical protein